MQSSVDTTQNRLLSVALLVAALATWELAVRLLGIPSFVLPPPSAVAAGLWRGFSSGLYLQHIAVTMFEVLLGFALGCSLGFVLGVAVALNRHVAYFLYPYIVMFLSMPKVALAPLIVLWFGLGMTSKIVTAALVSFFPLMVNTIAGLNAADGDRVDLIRSLGGSERQIFTMLRLPTALPMVIAGLEIAITLSLIGTVVAEFLGAEQGLGMLMQSMNFSMDIAGSFSVLIVLAIVGLVLNQALLAIRHRVLFWERLGRGASSAPKATASPAAGVPAEAKQLTS
ncbi:NitT/TauT family transport system permease protein [Bradyrhizobium sp. USDA 3240]